MAGMVRPVAKEAKINKWSDKEPKSGGKHGIRTGNGPGAEKKANMAGAIGGNPTDGNPLRGAVQELGRQHPYAYDDMNPHHSDRSHMRHESVSGSIYHSPKR